MIRDISVETYRNSLQRFELVILLSVLGLSGSGMINRNNAETCVEREREKAEGDGYKFESFEYP